MDKEEARAYRERWAAVAEIEEREMREATIEAKWLQLNSILRLAAALQLDVDTDDDEVRVVRERWRHIREVLSRRMATDEINELPSTLEPLEVPLQALQRLLDHFDGKGVIIGGVAVSLLGRPRLTADADALLLLSTEDLPQLVQLAQQEGFTPRLADAEQFARQSRVLLLRHAESGINVDISLGFLPFEVEMVERSQPREIGSLRLNLPSPDDLIIMKAVAHRAKDMDDIVAIISVQPTLDRKRIEFWVKQFAEAHEMPELWSDVAKLLRKVRS